MTLEEKIYKDYVEAMKAKDKPRFEFLNYLRAEIKNAAISAKKDKLSDEEALAVIRRQKKRLQDAKDSIGSADKPDFIREINFQTAILNVYLPQELSEQELSGIIAQVIAETSACGMKDMGKVMKEVTLRAGGRAEAKKTSEIVKDKLSKLQP